LLIEASSSSSLSIKIWEYSTDGGTHLSYSFFWFFFIKSIIGTLTAAEIWTVAPECELIFKLDSFKKQANKLIDKFSINNIFLLVEILLEEFKLSNE